MRTRLLVMMFLQYAIWGAWAPVLWPHLTGPLGMTQTQAGWVFGTLWLACMLAPFTGGQLVDRWVPTQLFLGVAHLAAGAVLIALGMASPAPGQAFWLWMPLMGAYALLYAPTLALTNSLALTHLGAERDFGRVRVGGTIGWIVSGLVLSTDCRPIAGALLDFWQCDDAGEYDNRGFRLRGHQFTDQAGRYQLETIVPGVYPGRTRHLHVKVQAPGGRVLTTQQYFPNEPGNARDGIFDRRLMMAVQDTANGKLAAFNYVLRTG